MREKGLKLLLGVLICILALGLFSKSSSKKLVEHNSAVAEEEAENAVAEKSQHEENQRTRAEEAGYVSVNSKTQSNTSESSSSTNANLYPAVNLFNESSNSGDVDRNIYTCGGTCQDGDNHKF